MKRSHPVLNISKITFYVIVSDNAQHPQEALIQIHGEHPMCIEKGCKQRAIEAHHCMGRGNAKNKEDRKIHSSVYGAAPLCRNSHEKGGINRKEKRQELLLLIRDKIALSSYKLIEIDRQFLEKYADYYK